MKKFLFTTALALSLASCTTMSVNQSKVGTQQISINNTKWQLVDFNSRGKVPTLEISGNKVSGTASCNTYFGEIVLNESNGTFDASKIASTRMMCTAIASETAYLKLLDEANSYVVTNDTLELYKDGLLLLKYKKL